MDRVWWDYGSVSLSLYGSSAPVELVSEVVFEEECELLFEGVFEGVRLLDCLADSLECWVLGCEVGLAWVFLLEQFDYFWLSVHVVVDNILLLVVFYGFLEFSRHFDIDVVEMAQDYFAGLCVWEEVGEGTDEGVIEQFEAGVGKTDEPMGE